jgi:5'-3' exoribonuclease 1
MDVTIVILRRVAMSSSGIDPSINPYFIADYLYLDMNGIIHNCTHPNDGQVVHLTETEMVTNIFRYIENLFNIVKPRKTFFMAIDGKYCLLS